MDEDVRDEEQQPRSGLIDKASSAYDTTRNIQDFSKRLSDAKNSKQAMGGYDGQNPGKYASDIKNAGAGNPSAVSDYASSAGNTGAEAANSAAKVATDAAESGAAKAAEAGASTAAKTAASAGTAAAAEGGTAAATTGAAAGAGAATGGLGALIVLGLKAGADSAKSLKNEVTSIWEKTDYDDAFMKVPFLIKALLVFLLISNLAALILLTPIAALGYGAYWAASNVGEIRESIGTYFEGQTEKSKFLMDELCIDKYDKTAVTIIHQQQAIDSSNVDIYMAIIDKAIENSFRKKAYSYISTPEIIKGFFTGHSVTETFNYYRNQQYPYTLAHEDGFFYTIGDFLDGTIPEEELNNDLNYAEIICVLSQENPLTGFSYSDFYDLLMSDEACSLLYEMEMSDRKYFYYDEKGNIIKFSIDDINTILDKIKNGEIVTKPVSSDNPTNPDNPVNSQTPNPNDPLANADNLNIFFMYETAIYPYGLKDLYDIAGIDMYADNEAVSSMRNIDVLDENENWLRARLPDISMGPKWNEKRNFYSMVSAAYRQNTSLTASGRSLLFYTENYVNSASAPGFDYGSGDPNDFQYNYTGQSVILDFPYYINQGNYPNDYRGTDGKGDTIKKSGCTDCSYTMVVSYFTRKNLSIQSISRNYVKSNTFQTTQFLTDNGLSEARKSFSVTNICNDLIEGKPCVIHISGRWTYNGRTYHSSSRGHFLVIIGFDDTGFYVFDPGSSSNTKNGPIPYAAWSHVDIKTVRPITSSNASFVPYYKVNTFKETK